MTTDIQYYVVMRHTLMIIGETMEVIENRLDQFNSLTELVSIKVNSACNAFGIQNDLGHVSKDDLSQAGLIAAWKSIPDFDPDKGVKLTTFAGYRIYGAILDELRRTTAMHKMPGKRAKMFDIGESINLFTADDLELDNMIDIKKALNSRLVSDYKKEIFLQYIGGDSGRELARIHSVSHTRISQIVNEVAGILKKLLSN